MKVELKVLLRNRSHLVRDPVCGTPLEGTAAEYSTQRLGRTVYFCSPACKLGFKKGLTRAAVEQREFRRAMQLAARKSRNRSDKCDTCA